MIPNRESWAEQAKCRQPQQGDPFFEDERWPKESWAEYANRLCRNCPVLQACGELAFKHNIVDGIWGGTSPKCRTRIREGRSIVGRNGTKPTAEPSDE